MMNELIDINCPFQKRLARGLALERCNRVIVRVYPGSAGEAWCRSCKLGFDFEVNSQGDYKSKVVVQREQNTKV